MALLHVNFFSNTLGMCVSMDVILPQKTQGQIGMSDDHTIWQRRTAIERYADAYDLAIIMPSTALGWYTDMAIGPKWYSYIAKELPGICKQFFPISDKREDTFVAGLSMGGYGAMKLALSAPEAFSHAATLSGAVDFAALLDERWPTETPDSRRYYEGIFGPHEAMRGGRDDLLVLAKQCAKADNMPRVYQCCGTEDFLYKNNLGFRDHLRALGCDLTYEEGPGTHAWDYWDAQIQKVLAWLPLEKRFLSFS